MKRLILIRHAKSSWSDPYADDHARVLNERGRTDADTIGGWLKAKGYIPDHIHTSDAARTVETSARIRSAMGVTPDVTEHARMYHGTPAALMNVMTKAKGDVIALVAHNPGIAFFAESIVAQKPDHPRFMDYPTCATLVCDFAINEWAEAVARSGQVVDFVVPSDVA